MMNRYEVQRFLEKFQEANREIDSLTEERERIRSVLFSITPNYGGDVGAPGVKDKIGDNVPKLVEVERRMDAEIAFYVAVRQDVRNLIRLVTLHNAAWGQCLLYRYVRGWSPKKTAYEMGYAPSTERGLHRDALDYACKAASEMGVEKTPSLFIA